MNILYPLHFVSFVDDVTIYTQTNPEMMKEEKENYIATLLLCFLLGGLGLRWGVLKSFLISLK